MITEQLLKSNFSGKDGFSWWIGRVAHPKYWKLQNLASAAAGSESHRVKVRIIGYHPWDDTLKENDLPWANVMMDPVTGSGQGSMGDTINLVGGETAIGFFADGEEAQQPIIIGLLHRSHEVSSSIAEDEVLISGSNQFKPFTGYSGKVVPGRLPVKGTKRTSVLVENPTAKKGVGTTTGKVEFGSVDLGISNKLGIVNESSNVLFDGDGNTVSSGSAEDFTRKYTRTQVNPSVCEDNVIGDIAKALNDFVKFTSVLESFQGKFIDPLTNAIVDMEQRIRETARKIQKIIKKVLNNIRTGLIKRIMKLFKIFAAVGKKINPLDFFLGPAAQKAFEKIMDILFCLFDTIFGDIFGFIENIIKALLGKIINVGVCAVEQFTSGILGKVMDTIKKVTSPVLSGINWLTGGLGNITSVLSKASNFAKKIIAFLDCTGIKCDETSEWVTNFGGSIQVKADNWSKILEGTDFLGGVQKDLTEIEKQLGRQELARWIAGENLDEAKKTIINGSNVYELLKTIDKITDGKTSELFEKGGLGSIEAAIASYSIFGNGADSFSDCNNRIFNPRTQDDLSPLPVGVKHAQCIPPAAEINGAGTGAIVKPIVGNNRQIFSVEVLNGGSGYNSATSITIFDKSNHGEGARGSVIVENGSVKSIVLINQGSGYCGGDLDVSDGTGGDNGTNIGIGTNVSGIVTSVYVSRPGLGYTGGDTFTLVGSGVTGSLTVTPNGSIIGAQLPTNYNFEFDKRPIVLFNTNTGFNGQLIPIMKYNAQLVTDRDGLSGVRPLIGITSVIDCPPKEHFPNQTGTVESTQTTTTTTSTTQTTETVVTPPTETTTTTPTETTTTTPTPPTQTSTPNQNQSSGGGY